MTATTGQISGDVIDAIRPDLEAFASLWSALRTNYQGTNITKTVARLLHMYQPEDGVLAYERLLRTLYVLLEDFDGDGLRLLVSMVPPPKGVADEIIKEVFHKATGFVRLNAPIFNRNNSINSESDTNSSSGAKSNDGFMDSRNTTANASTPRLQTVLSNAENVPQGTTILRAIVKSEAPEKNNKSPKFRPKDSEVFRGFPSNEITNTQSHARNVTHFYGPTSNYGGYPQRYADCRETQPQNAESVPSHGMDPSAYKLKWVEAPMMVRKNNYDGSSNYPDLILKTSDNKFIRLPITKINGSPIGSYTSSYNIPIQTAYQAYYQNSQLHLRNDDCNFDSTKSNLSLTNPSHPYPIKKFEDNEKSDASVREKFEGLANPRIGLVDHDYGCLRSEDYIMDKENYEIENLGSPNNETIEKFRDTVKNSQRAIQEDIYRMDVVRCDDDVLQTTAEELNYFEVENLTVTKELKKAAGDFLKRAEEQKILESSPLLRTRMLQDPKHFPPLEYKSSPQTWKIEKLKKHREKLVDSSDTSCNFTGKNVARECSENSVSSIKNRAPINQNSNRGSRRKIEKNQAASKFEKTSQKITNFRRNSSGKNGAPNSSIGTINEDTFGQISVSPMESLAKRNETHQTNSMADLVNYRKQYWDALLSIQRAKAVANSLAISSSQTSTSCDPRVFQYVQFNQHQMLQQQQQRLLMTPQHSVNRQAFVQPSFSNLRGAAALWIRGLNEWKYSPCGQYAFPHQTFPMSTSSSSSSCPAQVPVDAASESSISGNCPRTTHHLHRPSKPAVKRRKLEDIVGKLRDTDDHN